MTPITRRRLLALLPPVLTHSLMARTLAAQPPPLLQSHVFSRKPKPPQPAPHPFAYFGTDTAKPGAKGIYLSRFDPTRGQFTPPGLAAATFRPVYLASNQANGKHVVYATNEGDAHTSKVSTFLADPATGSLKLLNEVPSAGAGPCYIGVEASGQFAFIANYAGGTVTSYKVAPDGTLSQPLESIDFHNKDFGTHGPVAARQDGPHPHSSMLSPDNRFLIVNDLGNDNIAVFPIHPETGRMGPPTLTQNRTPGSGPRHLAFHPNGRWAYGIDELSNRIDSYLWNATHTSSTTEAQGLLTDTNHSVDTLDPAFKGNSTAAEILLSSDGFFVYASNRGEDSLVVFKVDQSTGALTLAQRISCGGRTPRHFTLDPTGAWLICGNQESDSVTVFARNEGTGHLSGPVQTLPLASPVFTLFV